MNPYPNPADHPEAQGFLRHIADHPGDNLGRLIFADWLEDNDYHNASMGQRWAAKTGRRPLLIGDAKKTPYGWMPSGITADFMAGNDSTESYLPGTFARHTPAVFGFRYGPDAGLAHEADFVTASHRHEWDENGDPK